MKTLEERVSIVERRSKRVDEDVQTIVGTLRRIEDDQKLMWQEIRVLKTDVAELKSDVAVLKTDVAVLKTDVAGLKQDMGDVKGMLTLVLERLPLPGS